MKKYVGNVARAAARAAPKYKPPRPANKTIHPSRPYPVKRPSLASRPISSGLLSSFFNRPQTQTPTITGTGNTTTTGGDFPGAPDVPVSGMPPAWQAPKIKNWAKATPEQIAQAMLAPQYASVYQQQHQDQLFAGQQQAAIAGFGGALAKILGEAGPGGVKGTLGPDFAAALSMQAMRNFAYQQFVTSQKYADEYAKIAAQYPSYVTQALANQAQQKAQADEMKLKWASFNLQKTMAVQQYGLNVAKTKAYNQATNVRLMQSQQRIGLSKKQYQLSVAKAKRSAAEWNAEQSIKANTIDMDKSKAAGKWVNSQGQIIKNVPFKNPPPPYYKPSAGSKGGGPKNPDAARSKELGYWVYSDLTRVPKKVIKARNMPPKPPPRWQGSASSPGTKGPKLPPGYSRSAYRKDYGEALQQARMFKEDGDPYSAFMQQAIENGIPRWVAKKAAKKYYPKAY